MVGDAFDSSTIPKCDAIFMKHTLHAFPDEDCRKILKSCHEVSVKKLSYKGYLMHERMGNQCSCGV